MELKVSRKSPSSLFFKTSHKDKEYRSISIKRQDVKWLKEEVGHLNKSHYEISKEKYNDLISKFLCAGERPL